MAFLYGLLRALATGLRMLASGRQAHYKKRYERAENDFQGLEAECKAHEVEIGRPVNFSAQFRLMKAFEAKEKAREQWMRAARRLANFTVREDWLKDLRGRKIPYTLGLFDMASVMYAFDRFGGWEFDPAGLLQQFMALLW
jgi:hypothetical protein